MKLHRVMENLYAFHCPGCACDHQVPLGPKQVVQPPIWEWNGSLDKPTIKPSINVNGSAPAMQCHSHVIDGKIAFGQDCFHSLKGKTVELPEYEE